MAVKDSLLDKIMAAGTAMSQSSPSIETVGDLMRIAKDSVKYNTDNFRLRELNFAEIDTNCNVDLRTVINIKRPVSPVVDNIWNDFGKFLLQWKKWLVKNKLYSESFEWEILNVDLSELTIFNLFEEQLQERTGYDLWNINWESIIDVDFSRICLPLWDYDELEDAASVLEFVCDMYVYRKQNDAGLRFTYFIDEAIDPSVIPADVLLSRLCKMLKNYSWNKLLATLPKQWSQALKALKEYNFCYIYTCNVPEEVTIDQGIEYIFRCLCGVAELNTGLSGLIYAGQRDVMDPWTDLIECLGGRLVVDNEMIEVLV